MPFPKDQTTPPETASDPGPGEKYWKEAVQAKSQLDKELRLAGVNVQTGMVEMVRGIAQVQMGLADHRSVLRLAELIHEGNRPLYEAESELRAAFTQHALDVPDLFVSGGQFRLGAITVETADRLASLLGAPQQATGGDLDSWSEGQRATERLAAAVEKATGEFHHIEYHPACTRSGGCNVDAAVDLASISVRTARRVADALRKAMA
ncbi:hypothetical protein [Streptomyces sp. NPDC059850]|uniref:hypothetical protein n=1 Tax=Streptomyces sp. NPDC059850 TaxID=3346970 RepID=UPI00364ED473